MVCRVSFEWVKWHLSARSRYPRAVTCVTYRDEGKSFTKGCEGKSNKKTERCKPTLRKAPGGYGSIFHNVSCAHKMSVKKTASTGVLWCVLRLNCDRDRVAREFVCCFAVYWGENKASKENLFSPAMISNDIATCDWKPSKKPIGYKTENHNFPAYWKDIF